MAELYGHASTNVMVNGVEGVEAPLVVSMKHHHDPATTATIFCNSVLGDGTGGTDGTDGGRAGFTTGMGTAARRTVSLPSTLPSSLVPPPSSPCVLTLP